MDGLWRVTLADMDYGPEEERAVAEVIRSKWLTMGEKTAEFEQKFGEACSSRHCIAVSNCTAALHLALLAAGIGPGDEVIVPSLTFVATANAVIYCGATPVFGDIYGATRLHLDPEDVELKITSRTKAIVPVHYAGYACDMGAFAELAKKYKLTVVDDAAHAPGASWCGTPIGSAADITCFSFFSNKNLSTGEGGMVTTDDDRIAELVRRNRSHGMTTVTLDRHKGHAFSYDVVSAGYNYRMTEIQAALGLVQLQKLSRNNARRRAIVSAYQDRLRRRLDITVPFASRTAESSCHIFPIVLPEGCDRERLQRAMKSAGIQTSIHYPPVHQFSNFVGRFSCHVPRLTALAPRLLTLPLHPLMTQEQVDYVCDHLQTHLDMVSRPPGAGAVG